MQENPGGIDMNWLEFQSFAVSEFAACTWPFVPALDSGRFVCFVGLQV